MNPLTGLEAWYAAQCDGDWEHKYGIRIETLDNPGWLLEVDLTDTSAEQIRTNRIEQHVSETDWYSYQINENGFVGACGSCNLDALISAFLALVGDESVS